MRIEVEGVHGTRFFGLVDVERKRKGGIYSRRERRGEASSSIALSALPQVFFK